MQNRPSARRRHRHLATAVTAVLTITAGTALATTPATAAAPMAVQAPAAPLDGAIAIPQAHRIVGSGPSGFLTVEYQDGIPVHRWTSTVDRTTTTLPKQDDYFVGHSDTVVTESTTGQYLLRDMSVPGGPTAVIEGSTPGTRLRGVVGRTLLLSTFDGAKGQLRLKSEGVGADSERVVTGLPADTRIDWAEAVSPTTALVQYVAGPHPWTPRLAVVDVTTAQVVEERPASADDSAADASSFAWVEGLRLRFAARGGADAAPAKDLVTLVDEGWNFASMHIGLVGPWVTYALRVGYENDRRSRYNPLTAVDSRNPAAKVTLLDHATSTVSAPDGTLLVRGGTVAHGEGVYRIALNPATGKPSATLVASTGESTALVLRKTEIPAPVDLGAPDSGSAKLSWTLSRNAFDGKVTLRHKATGQTTSFTVNSYVNPPVDGRFTIGWNGTIGQNGGYAPAGDYTWELNATPDNGIGPDLKKTGTLKVVRKAGLHDLTSNTSPDILARDASGKLWRDDTATTDAGDVTSSGRYAVGPGWQIYNRLEAVGNLAGSAAPDLVARDASGVLWLYQGNGNGGFATRARIGAGWNAYSKLTGGSDLNGDGRSDLLATDTSGVLWFYKGTGRATAPFAGRVRVGGGWGGYNQITATGNLAGTAAGDLVARDTAGVLWLYQGNGRGAFTTRVRIGGGWGEYTDLVGIGDADHDGRADLYAAGPYGSRLYPGTGIATRPFKGGIASDIHSGPDRFNSVF
ncbi:FG-GAP repeat domain-containing protein [Streptomyces sp. NPDC050842]|uniref:FG-GAP repeat domain-containing protein n=1 Tax=Streptomyces sp. NPDC050842 TaxID=3365636 RepID=UPI0037A2A642